MPGKKNMLAIQATGSKFKSSNEAMGSGRFRWLTNQLGPVDCSKILSIVWDASIAKRVGH